MSAINWPLSVATIGIIFIRGQHVGHRHHEGLIVARGDDQEVFLVNSFADPPCGENSRCYVVRGYGGILYLSGALIMVWNMWMTIKGRKTVRTRWPFQAE